MSRLSRVFGPLGVASALAFAGCGGSGQEAGPPASPGGTSEPAVVQHDSKGKTGDVPAKEVTPNRSIDPKKVVDVVEAEVKGGEAEKGPSRVDHLWQLPDVSKVQDETLVVEVPKGLQALMVNINVPASNPLTKGKFELGRQLYFDPRVSKDGTVSCATCHNPERGWSDNMKTSIGILGQVGGRNAPVVTNTAYGKTMFWDGRAPSLEGQAQGPIQNKIEMGDQSYEQIVDRLRTIPGYKAQFAKVFGTDVTLDGMSKAIATFERVAALSGNSPYDRYLDTEDPNHNKALDESQKRGMVLFGLQLNGDDEYKPTVQLKKANCTACHAGFNFTDEQFHNLGVGWDASANKLKDGGRYEVEPVGAKNPVSLGAFKTPTCRDIEKSAPFMHDGSEPTLEAVIDYYDKGGNPNPTLDRDIKPLKLTPDEKKDLVAFLKALDGRALEARRPAHAPPRLRRQEPGPEERPGAALGPEEGRSGGRASDGPVTVAGKIGSIAGVGFSHPRLVFR